MINLPLVRPYRDLLKIVVLKVLMATSIMKRPDCVYFGMGKSGSSTIHRFLRAQAGVAPSRPKEIQYWANNWDKGPSFYNSHFRHASRNDLKVDFSFVWRTPRDKGIYRLIACTGSKIKLVFCARNPVTYLISRYMHAVRLGKPVGSFSEFALSKSEHFNTQVCIGNLRYAQKNAQLKTLIFERDIVTGAYQEKLMSFFERPYIENEETAAITANKGIMPRYFLPHSEDIDVVENGKTYRIPANTLVFCSKPWLSRAIKNPSLDQVTAARNNSDSLSRQLSCEDIELAMALSQDFVDEYKSFIGDDIPEWDMDVKERVLNYELANIPDEFLLERV